MLFCSVSLLMPFYTLGMSLPFPILRVMPPSPTSAAASLSASSLRSRAYTSSACGNCFVKATKGGTLRRAKGYRLLFCRCGLLDFFLMLRPLAIAPCVAPAPENGHQQTHCACNNSRCFSCSIALLLLATCRIGICAAKHLKGRQTFAAEGRWNLLLGIAAMPVL